MTRRMRMESSVAPRAESTAPWLLIVRRSCGARRGRNRAILAEELIHFYDLVEPFAFALISPSIDNQQPLAPNLELSWPLQQTHQR